MEAKTRNTYISATITEKTIMHKLAEEELPISGINDRHIPPIVGSETSQHDFGFCAKFFGLHIPSEMRHYKSYTGLVFMLAVVVISVLGNLLFQAYLFPIFPYPIFVSLISAVFPAVFAFTSFRKDHDPKTLSRYTSTAPLILFNSIISGVLFNWSLLLTSMSASTVISSSSTLFSLLFSRILLNTPINWSTIISINMSMVGSMLVILSSASADDALSLHHLSGISVVTDATSFSKHLTGCVLALFSSASSGLTTVLFQKFEITDSELYLSISGLSALGYLCLYLTVNKLIYSFESLTLVSTDRLSPLVYMLILNGLVSCVIGYYLYIEAINRLKSATTVNVLFALSIPLTVIIDYYRGQVHAVTPSFLIGALLVIASTVLVPFEQEPSDDHTPNGGNDDALSRESSTFMADPVLCQDIPLLIFEEPN